MQRAAGECAILGIAPTAHSMHRCPSCSPPPSRVHSSWLLLLVCHAPARYAPLSETRAFHCLWQSDNFTDRTINLVPSLVVCKYFFRPLRIDVWVKKCQVYSQTLFRVETLFGPRAHSSSRCAAARRCMHSAFQQRKKVRFKTQKRPSIRTGRSIYSINLAMKILLSL
jgi:hypothetical protein